MCSKHLLGGSSIKVKTPDITQVAPTPQIVSQNEVTDSTGDEEAARRKKRKRGYASTLLASTGNDSTLAASSVSGSGDNRGTLG